MLFNSPEFVLLVGLAFFVYYLPFMKRLQVPLLIVTSYVFYLYHSPWLALLLLCSSLTNALLSYQARYGTRPKIWATVGVIANLSILCFFKYAKLLVSTFVTPFTSAQGLDWVALIPLPVGISFFTFQGISLVVDCYTRDRHGFEEIADQKRAAHARKTVFFVSFFPHLVAGPIVKAREFFFQITPKEFRNIDWRLVFESLVIGYFLKSVVADSLADQTKWLTFPYFQQLSSLTLVALVLGYSFQIFSDFAGYSLIAIGVAALFGYRLPDNFRYPYISRTFSEFWTRWHISLSTWLREYLYIPLGGNRAGRVKTYRNLMIVMVLGGIWHGAAWNYALWGFWHGLLLAIERVCKNTFSIRFPGWLAMAIVFVAVSLGWLFFQLPAAEHTFLYLAAIVKNTDLPHDKSVIFHITFFSVAPIFLHFLAYLKIYHGESLAKWRLREPLTPVLYATMLFLLLTSQGPQHAFIYFQF